jgi:hypothetical protein
MNVGLPLFWASGTYPLTLFGQGNLMLRRWTLQRCFAQEMSLREMSLRGSCGWTLLWLEAVNVLWLEAVLALLRTSTGSSSTS